MPDTVRSPRLLDANLQEARRLRPTALSLSLNRRSVSTAQITLPGEDEALPLMGFAELYLRRGSAGIYRVKETSQAAKGSNTRTYALSHAVSTLHDSVWRAQEDFSGTVTVFLTQLLGYQQTARWQLGTVQDTGTWKRSGINYDHLDTLLYELAADRKDYLLTFDFSTSPWTLNFVQASGQVDCEMRMRRNLYDAQARGSLEGMCNRLYLTVHSTAQSQEDLTVTEPTTQLLTYNDTASQAEFGIIEDTADIDTADVPDVAAWVAAFFLEHAAPQTQTSADGYEVVKSTGEPFDQFDLGKRCRIPALQVEGPVESIRFENLLSDPDKTRLDLNQKQQSATGRLHSLKEQARAAAASARSAGYAAKKNAADVEKHYNHVVNVTDQGMSDCFGVIGVKIGDDGMPMRDEHGDYVWAGPNDSPAEIWGHLHRNAWTQVIQNHIQDEHGNILSIGQVLTSADGQVLINAINDQQTGTATINADRILINGNMTLNGAMSSDNGMLWIKVAAEFGSAGGQMVTINNGYVNAPHLQVNSGGTLVIVGTSPSGAAPTFNLGYSDFSNFMTSIGTPTISNTGEFKVPYYSLGVPDGTGGSQAGTINITHYHDITATEGTGTDAGKVFFTSGAVRSTAGTTNFNIAATQYYIDGVAAAYGDAAGRVSWPVPPRTQSSFSVEAPGSTWNASTETGTTVNRVFSLSAGAFDGTTHISTVNLTMSHSESGSAVTDGVVAKIDVNASGVYNAGSSSVTLNNPDWGTAPNPLTNSRTVSVWTSGRVNSNGVSDELHKDILVTLQQGNWSNNHKMIVGLQSIGAIRAQTEVDASGIYYAGWNSAASAVSYPGTASGQVLNATLTLPNTGASSSTPAPTKDVLFRVEKSATPSANAAVTAQYSTNNGSTYTKFLRINVGNMYTAGWDAASALTVPPSAGTGTSFVFKSPTTTTDQQGNVTRAQTTFTFNITKDATPGSSGYAAVEFGGIAVGRISIGDWYDAGQDSVSAWIRANGSIVSGTLSLTSGQHITLYPSKKIGSSYTDITDYGVEVIAPTDSGSSVTLVSDNTSITATTASTDQIHFLGRRDNANSRTQIDVEVGVTLSNGKRYSRWITEINTGMTFAGRQNMYVYDSVDDTYVAIGVHDWFYKN